MIEKNGYYVNPENGECLDELVFSKENIFKRKEPKIKFEKFENKLLNSLNSSSTKNQTEKRLKKRLNDFMAHLNVSPEIKYKIKKYVIQKKPKNYSDLIFLTFKTIYDFNFPITTKELIKNLKKNGFKNKQIIRRIVKLPLRDNSWYVVKLLSNINMFSQEEQQRLYNIVKRNYDILSKALNLYSTAFMSTLTYLTIRQNHPKIRLKEIDLNTNNATVTYHRKRLDLLGINYPKKKRKRGEKI